MQLGLTYETCARIAIHARDGAMYAKYAALASDAYLADQGSLLSALYERLQEDARAAGLVEARMSLPLVRIASSVPSESAWFTQRVVAALAGRETWEERALAALRMLCESRNLRGGHLFLLTGDQLALAASDIPTSGLEDARSFAQRYLTCEIERLRAVRMLASSAGDPADMQSTAEDFEWIGSDGAHCRALLISGLVEGTLRIAGVALLADYNEGASNLVGLAAALAEQLVRDGDAKGAVIV